MILVTGAGGFIGSHLLNALAIHRPSERIRGLDLGPQLQKSPAVDFITGSIEDRAVVVRAVRGARVVVHLAGKVDPESHDIATLTNANVSGALNVYVASIQAGCELFVHISSAGVYGQPRSSQPFRESDDTLARTPYQRSKLEAEREIRQIEARATVLNVLRPAGVYGAGSRLEIPTYKKILRQRVSIELRGGVIVHPTHVSDVVGAILALVQQPAPHGSIFNIGGERRLLHQDLQALVAEILGVRRLRIVVPARLAGPAATFVDRIPARLRRRNPLFKAISRGQFLSAAVDDSKFRSSYRSVPVMLLRNGIADHIAWARANALL